jgi:hypothetical protein
MAALAPMPSPSDRMAIPVTNGVLNNVRSANLRFLMGSMDENEQT